MNFNPLPIVLCLVGAYFSVKLRFFYILHPVKICKKTFASVKDLKALKSLTLALAGTLGVGNVFGVALGIIVGGAGSVFWLLVSMVFAVVIKYAEVVAASDNLYHDTDSHGGMYYVIKNSFRRCGSGMAKLYAFSVILLSLFMGAALQCSTVRETFTEVQTVPAATVALILAALVIFAITGGAKKIEKITVVIIPLTTIIYIILTLTVIAVNIDGLPTVIKMIFSGAFRVDSAVGGVLGFLLGAPFHEGFARGLLSNEAGAGTSSMAHARSGVLNPASAGLLGAFEVWFDTGFICMLTAFSILLSVPDVSYFNGGMELIMHAVSGVFGNAGKYSILFAVFSFAFATVICWYYYGMESFCAVFGTSRRAWFMLIFILFVFFGTFFTSSGIVGIVDILMTVITVLTLLALIKNSDRIKSLSERGGVIDRSNKYSKYSIRGSVSSRGHSH